MNTENQQQDNEGNVEQPVIDWDDPLGMSGSPTEYQLQQRDLLLRVDRACAALYSSNPLYQAKAANDPDYWENFSLGGVSMP